MLNIEFNFLIGFVVNLVLSKNYGEATTFFLRYKISTTPQYLNDVGLDYDETLSYADVPGFRCGICYDYPAFNLQTREKINLIIRPLILMECGVLDKDYLGLDIENGAALDKILQLKNTL